MNFRTAIVVVLLFTIMLTMLMVCTRYFGGLSKGKKYANNDKVKLIRILCFGDSLTRGLTSNNNGNHYHYPYSNALEKYLNKSTLQKRSSTRKFIVHSRGIDGEEVRGSMEKRLPRLLKTTHYNWVIILGGANDLRVLHENNPRGITYPQKLYQPIIDALIKLHENVHKHGGKTVAVTIPGRRRELKPDSRNLKDVRLWLNDKIREYSDKFKDRVVLADLDKEMNMDVFLQKYWVDDVHYNQDGYDRMGQIIFNAMSSSL